jgi:Rrf2 family protein
MAIKISTRLRYGTRALLELALRQGDGPVQLKLIARDQQVSLQYLEHLIRPLVAAGVIKSMRGARGGVWLGKPPQSITLAEIVYLLEGSTDPVECVSDSRHCSLSGNCVMRDIWTEMKGALDDFLNSTTLQDIVERQKQKEQIAGDIYYI